MDYNKDNPMCANVNETAGISIASTSSNHQESQPVVNMKSKKVEVKLNNAAHEKTWMTLPSAMNSTSGLEFLTHLDQLLIQQEIDIRGVMTRIEMNNRYWVKNIVGQVVFYAKEDTDCNKRNIYGNLRPFVIHVYDCMHKEIFQIKRYINHDGLGNICSCFNKYQDEIEVTCPPGKVIGYVRKISSVYSVRYVILNENEEVVLKLHGRKCLFCYCPGDEYSLGLFTADRLEKVGKVTKEWSNLFQESFTSADNFRIKFPIDLDCKIKAVIIGAVFLLDIMLFDYNNTVRR